MKVKQKVNEAMTQMLGKEAHSVILGNKLYKGLQLKQQIGRMPHHLHLQNCNHLLEVGVQPLQLPRGEDHVNPKEYQRFAILPCTTYERLKIKNKL